MYRHFTTTWQSVVLKLYGIEHANFGNAAHDRVKKAHKFNVDLFYSDVLSDVLVAEALFPRIDDSG